MGKGEEHSSVQTPSSSNSPTADIPSSNRYFVDYTNAGYYGQLPGWPMHFPPYPDGGQYPTNIQVNADYPTPPLMNRSSAMSGGVDTEEAPLCRERDIPCTSGIVEESKEDRGNLQETEEGIVGTPQLEDEVGGDMIEEPKSGMEFNSFRAGKGFSDQLGYMHSAAAEGGLYAAL